MKLVKDLRYGGKEFPSFSKEELKEIHFKGKTQDSRFQLLTDCDYPKVCSTTTLYFKDGETGKIYGTTATMGWEKEVLSYGAAYEVEEVEQLHIAYRNVDAKKEGYYLDFKRKRSK